MEQLNTISLVLGIIVSIITIAKEIQNRGNGNRLWLFAMVVLVGILLAPSLSSNLENSIFANTASYSDISGYYNGNIHNTLADIPSTMTLQIEQDQTTISGTFTVQRPLLGDGPFTGNFTTQTDFVFTVHSSEVSAPILFQGAFQPDQSLAGTYCSVNPHGRCDTNVGGKGTWHVFKD